MDPPFMIPSNQDFHHNENDDDPFWKIAMIDHHHIDNNNNNYHTDDDDDNDIDDDNDKDVVDHLQQQQQQVLLSQQHSTAKAKRYEFHVQHLVPFQQQQQPNPTTQSCPPDLNDPSTSIHDGTGSEEDDVEKMNMNCMNFDVTYTIDMNTKKTNDVRTKMKYSSSSSNSTSTSTSIPFHLQPLPPSDGIWSPLGAEAWYGSAVLASLLLLPSQQQQLSQQHIQQKSQQQEEEHKNVESFHTILGNHRIHDHIKSVIRSFHMEQQDNGPNHRKHMITALELGSGAVGISSVALALLLTTTTTTKTIPTIKSSTSAEVDEMDVVDVNSSSKCYHHNRILLSDHDPLVLQNLKWNMEQNFHSNKSKSSNSSNNRSSDSRNKNYYNQWQESYPNLILPEINIIPLDWNMTTVGHHHNNDCCNPYLFNSQNYLATYNNNACMKQNNNNNNILPPVPTKTTTTTNTVPTTTPPTSVNIHCQKEDDTTTGTSSNMIHFVIGSELVYTNETAQACFHIVTTLLQSNPNLLIVLVQVSDRDGWKNNFIPALQQYILQKQKEKKNDDDNDDDQQQKQRPLIQMELQDPIYDGSYIHEYATQLVRPGGTLDISTDYCACYIWNY